MHFLKKIFFFLPLLTTLHSDPPPLTSIQKESIMPAYEPKLIVHNRILYALPGKAFSLLDVTKKLDEVFEKAYPDLAASSGARYQFYNANWKSVFMDLVFNQLILADAKAKELKLTDGEIREEMDSRYGPNVHATLEKQGRSYEEVWQALRDEMSIERMRWFFIQGKAIQNVTPQKLKAAYTSYVANNPPKEHWTYQMISCRGDVTEEAKQACDACYELLLEKKLKKIEEIPSAIKELQEKFSDIKIEISTPYKVTSEEASEEHRKALSDLDMMQFSKPLLQIMRKTQTPVYRIFYLSEKTEQNPSPFSEMAGDLKQKLLQEEAATYSQEYFEKLCSKYNLSSSDLKEVLSIENDKLFSLK